MNFNFPLVLVIATFLCGLVWLIDAMFFAKTRRRKHLEAISLSGGPVTGEVEEYVPWAVEYARSFFPVLFIVLILRSFIFEPFRIPSGSMIPTLLVGDFILVNKFSYGVRLPVIHTKIFGEGSPKRGDVAVFRFPENPRQDYIKRVIGVPGDKIVYQNKTLFINGEEVAISDADNYIDPRTDKKRSNVIEASEDLLGVKHQLLLYQQRQDFGRRYKYGDVVVPEGHYFMMGDNRDDSNDSRFWGFVPEENLVGRAFYIWLNLHDWSVIWSRIGDKIE